MRRNEILSLLSRGKKRERERASLRRPFCIPSAMRGIDLSCQLGPGTRSGPGADARGSGARAASDGAPRRIVCTRSRVDAGGVTSGDGRESRRVTSGKRLMNAFQYDCQTLLTRFELTYNTHFQNFCEIWREMQFSLIFDCQSSEVTLRIFCENALHVTKQFLIKASSLKERIGALYLMYSVYYMLQKNDLKIRMTFSDWECLMNLHQQIKVEQYLDANYILCKLIVDRAFIHCFSDSEFGINKHYQKSKTQSMLDYSLSPKIKELAAPGKLLSTISHLSKIYTEKKHILLSEQEISSVQLYDANMADNIIDSIRTMQSQNRIFSQNISEDNNDESPALMPASALASTSEAALASTSESAPTSSLSVLMSTSNNQSSQKIKKRRNKNVQRRKKLILAKIGSAFETALRSESEDSSEEEVHMEIDSDTSADPLEDLREIVEITSN
ncbi:PREDICTED: snRNA-activating protein complex subunit 1 isoform X2 [Dinoponera quadriceps]|uniref:snRNA-activating protein complex subunit 1 isoform X2 n=1 Tax=Dinoponera quadriceps TaxID=609295 RepID=A0A6P3WPU1_DINQU|nr:PREDICTED: snRNA-activating protein complex subunit 1 isoform X2 [Dinoponera quadriceps]